MRLKEAIELFDSLNVNTLDREIKQKWISDLDMQVNGDIHMAHRCMGDPDFHGYPMDADQETELLVPAPYDEVYIHYMRMKWANLMQEDANYNRAANQYNSFYLGYADWVNRTHMPKPTRLKIV